MFHAAPIRHDVRPPCRTRAVMSLSNISVSVVVTMSVDGAGSVTFGRPAVPGKPTWPRHTADSCTASSCGASTPVTALGLSIFQLHVMLDSVCQIAWHFRGSLVHYHRYRCAYLSLFDALLTRTLGELFLYLG